MSKWAAIILWTGIGFFTACIGILSAVQLYFYFSPPIPPNSFRDPNFAVSHMFVLGPITLWDEQIVIVFGIVFTSSLALAIFSIRQCLLQAENTDK